MNDDAVVRLALALAAVTMTASCRRAAVKHLGVVGVYKGNRVGEVLVLDRAGTYRYLCDTTRSAGSWELKQERRTEYVVLQDIRPCWEVAGKRRTWTMEVSVVGAEDRVRLMLGDDLVFVSAAGPVGGDK